MKILVCIKQVPDMESKFKVDAAGTWYDNADLAWRMNAVSYTHLRAHETGVEISYAV